jgi:hypothetical protein
MAQKTRFLTGAATEEQLESFELPVCGGCMGCKKTEHLFILSALSLCLSRACLGKFFF